MAKEKSKKIIKVGSLAKKLKLATKDLLIMLKDLGVEAKTAASSIDDEVAQVVEDVVSPKKIIAPKTTGKKAEKEGPPVIDQEKTLLAELKQPAAPRQPEKSSAIIIETENISVKELSEKTKIKPSDLIKELMKKGLLATINQRIKADVAKEIVSGLGTEIVLKLAKTAETEAPRVDVKGLILRPPVVTIMGHVDHGKTKLLDAIRKTRVAEGEAGGITQHLGAYQVDVHGQKVTFLDTPGHEAFTSLRARGAKVTDIAVLVVAADDGVKPQTIEAIDHAKVAGVPIIVALNKIDKPGISIDRVKQQLSELELVAEDWGGKTIMVQTSATAKIGINELLEMILLVAEIQELRADPKGTPMGVVIESRVDKGRGPVADLLVKNGTLRVGDVFHLGATYGKVRALFNDSGERLKEAGPSTPVELLGCIDVPISGDMLEVVSSEKEARQIAEQKAGLKLKASRAKVLSLEDFSQHIKAGEVKNLQLVIKADVQGSFDAIVNSLQDLSLENIRLNIIHRAVGPVTESDVMLAMASNAIIIGFNVGYEGGAEALADKEGIEIRRYDIIYKLIDDVKLAMEGLLEPEYQEVILGHAEVRNLFKFSKVGVIAGSFVKDGKLVRGSKIRIFRDNKVVYEGKLESLKRFKEDVRSVEQNFECGIAITGYTNFIVGDLVEAFEIREKPRLK